MAKLPVTLSAGRDYNSPLHGRYEYVLFAEDETIVARASGYRSKGAALRAGHAKAIDLLTAPREAPAPVTETPEPPSQEAHEHG